MQKKKVIVFGGSGTLGKEILYNLANENFNIVFSSRIVKKKNHKGIKKSGILKNLRCDVMLQTNKSALNGSESGSFWLFKKLAPTDSYGNTTEALRRIGMNFTLYDHANNAETAYYSSETM